MKTIDRLIVVTTVAFAAFAAAGCSDNWQMYDTDQTPVIYFEENLMTHSASFAMIPDDDISVQTTVYVMGMPSDRDRQYSVSYIEAEPDQVFAAGGVSYPVKTARPGTDFTLGDLVVPAGEVSGTLDITIHRQPEMSEGNYLMIGLKLSENEEFTPCAADSSSSKILTPEYRYYVTDGEPSCPIWWRANATSALGWHFNWGRFYPQKYRKLLEYYHETEQTCPAFFNYCVEHYGYYLDADPDKELNNNMNTFWRQAYMAAWAKYVAMPLYDYYKEWYAAHPDDPDYENMGDAYVNITRQEGWGDPLSGTYGFLN